MEENKKKVGRPRKDDAKRRRTAFRLDDRHELMMKFTLKEQQKNTSEFFNEYIEKSYEKTKGYKRGKPFYCIQTREVFVSGKECCEYFGISDRELTNALHHGAVVNGYTFAFIK